MQCRNCGLENLPEASFCAKCGAALAVSPAPGVGSSYKSAWRQL